MVDQSQLLDSTILVYLSVFLSLIVVAIIQ